MPRMSESPLTALAALRALIADGLPQQALTGLEELTARHPDSADAWLALGEVRGMLDLDAPAEQAFRSAVALAPQRHEAQFNLALALTYQQRLREAVPHFVLARRLNAAIPGLDALLLDVVLRLLQSESPAPAPAFSATPLPANPLVSVIIPTRDRPALLSDALQSVCRQTYTRWEAVVVNDGGADVTAVSTVIAGLPAAMASRVTLLNAATPGGPARARNRAIAAARGAVLAFLDDDDLYHPHHLQTLVEGLADPRHGACHTRSEGVMETLTDGRRIEHTRGAAFAGFQYARLVLEVRNVIPINTWGLRRDCLAAAGPFDETLACAEDWEMLLRLSACTAINALPVTTTEVRMRENATDSVSTRSRLRPVCEIIYDRHHSAHPLVALARELYLASLA